MLSQPTDAASVLLARHPGSPETFVIRRADHLRFYGGFLAFPGGKVAEEDAAALAHSDLEVRADNIHRTAAVRELFEETGVLLARQPDGRFPVGSAELDAARKALLDGGLTFAAFLGRSGLRLRGDDLTPLGRFVTPPYSALRYDTWFFHADLPPGQLPTIWRGELSDGHWASAETLLRRWQAGACPLTPVAVTLLEAFRGRPVVDAAGTLPSLLSALGPDDDRLIRLAPGVAMLPLRTRGLPPSTHTNAYLLGTGPVVLLDPGADDPAEQERLAAILERNDIPARLQAVVLSHHHPDHVGAAAFCAARYGVPVWAHPLTAAKLAGRVTVDAPLHDGDRLELGPAADGQGRWELEVLHTPGHASGHLAFHEPRLGLLLAGDLVSTLSSVVIAPPDGDLRQYLDSLRRVRGLGARLLLPCHGAPSARPDLAIENCLVHRQRREEMLVAALSEGGRSVAELLRTLYRGVPEGLQRLATLQLQAGLLKLAAEGRAVSPEADVWARPAAPLSA